MNEKTRRLWTGASPLVAAAMLFFLLHHPWTSLFGVVLLAAACGFYGWGLIVHLREVKREGPDDAPFWG